MKNISKKDVATFFPWNAPIPPQVTPPPHFVNDMPKVAGQTDFFDNAEMPSVALQTDFFETVLTTGAR